MIEPAEILLESARLVESGVPFVLITVAGTQGSAPRNSGAKMLISCDGQPVGTIGGGELERLGIEAALEHLERKTCATQRFVLGADAGQCCGGTVDLLFEYVGPQHRLVVFGAGHVAGEIARVLSTAPFERIIVDDRPEWLTSARFPGWRLVNNFDQGIRFALEQPESTLACVLTCSHDQDFAVLEKLARHRLAFLGLIGSRSKWTCFKTRLAGAGVTLDQIERITCPIGLGDMGKSPPCVAVSIVAQILLEARKLEH